MTKNKILVVEDEAIIARDIAQTLEELGYDPVAVVETAEAAILAAEQWRPDLVLMDIHLAGEMDGIAGAQHLRDRLMLPVVFLTAFADEDTLRRAKITEPFGFIIKPFDGADLRTAIELGIHKHRAECRLRESENRFRVLSDSAPVMIWMTGPDQGCTYCNERWLTFTGRTFEQEKGEGWTEGLHPEDAPRTVENFRREFAARRKFSLEYRLRRADGAYRWILDHGAPRHDETGAFLGYVGSCLDITERRLLEEQIRHAQKMEVIGQLAGGVAHDFNNILTAMKLNLEFLRATQALPGAETSLDELEAMTERAAKLTRQLLMFARRQHLQVQPMEINGAVAALTRILQPILGDLVRIRREIGAAELWLEADAATFDQAVVNLCLNAREAMPGGGILTIRTEAVELDAAAAQACVGARPGAFVCLSINDTGVGMSAEVMAHLFEPFFTTKEVGQGPGLGLASVHGIVHQHHGWINVESVPGRGTTFRVYFPRLAREGTPAAGGGGGAATGRSSATILLVEDDDIVRRVTTSMLQRLGYRVVSAIDGQHALRLWHENGGEFDLLLTDMMMPGGLSGLEVGEKLRELKPSLRLLLMSGFGPALGGAEMAEQTGVNYLEKPFEPQTLAAAVRRCLA